MTALIAAAPSKAIVALIPALPLAGAAVLLLFGKRLKGELAGWLGSATIAGAFVLSLVTLLTLTGNPSSGRVFVLHL
ncbi:MAG TPA: NADH-quinone oxidoreductase subunit L, partial [Actinobacteria bacterium]|nr:NADH-quinone oxidoreductase subunit L [Actinomycetota bacterium]